MHRRMSLGESAQYKYLGLQTTNELPRKVCGNLMVFLITYNQSYESVTIELLKTWDDITK